MFNLFFYAVSSTLEHVNRKIGNNFMIKWHITKNFIRNYPWSIKIMEEHVARLINARAKDNEQSEYNNDAQDMIWLLEYAPLYSKGTSALPQELINSHDSYNFPVYDASRGGKYTYHGPGQRVVYTVLDLTRPHRKKDVRHFITTLETWIIRTLLTFGITGFTRKERPGVWVMHPTKGESKIAQVGVRIRKWVTFHGTAININPNLEHFTGIIPCGIKDFSVTSMQDMGVCIQMQSFDESLKKECPFT